MIFGGKMKKFAIVILSVVLSLFCFVGCNFGQEDETEISLTTDNYKYYLNLDSVCTGSGSAAGGSFRWSSHKLTITGAIDGLYVDCVLYYKTTDEGKEQPIELNASGFATLNYSVSNSLKFIIVRAEGSIYI